MARLKFTGAKYFYLFEKCCEHDALINIWNELQSGIFEIIFNPIFDSV
jgi:hypothetical protein